MSNMASALTGINGERVALADVTVAATLKDLLTEVTVSHTYHNRENENIEAVYTFPLPLDAVLLELEVEIAGQVLKGVVVEKAAAEEQYEEAIDEGDSAVMLEAIEPGLYTLNVGNLMPGELATIRFKYVMLYRWSGDRMRFFLPTTIAPRYGESFHQPHQQVEHSLTVENRFSLNLEISGSLSESQFNCPSHEVRLTRSNGHVVISLQQERAVMDRDFILSIKAPPATRSFAISGADGNDSAAVVSFQPFFPGLQQPRPLEMAILIDCSGSMTGDSISQAKQALAGIIDSLRPDDRATLIAFGSRVAPMSRRLLTCNKSNLQKMKRFAKKLDADMGGTEIGTALQQGYSAVEGTQCADIFLVTDGEVGRWEQVVEEAKGSGHRIFTVGVGSAVSEAFVEELASETGGHCELVSPREGMTDRVIRHFERMRAPRAKRVRINWPEGACQMAPSRHGAVFEGDTIVASAQFKHPSINGAVDLEVETETGEVFHQKVPLTPDTGADQVDRLSPVARLAAAFRLKELEEDAGAQTALNYRLVSPWTNWLVVAERAEDEKADETPALRKVPQTLAAGWGGSGSVMSIKDDYLACSTGFRDRAPRMEDLSSVAVFSSEAHSMAGLSYLEPGYRKLIELITEHPDRLDPSGAILLLEESGLISKFKHVLDLAHSLGLDIGSIASVILEKILRGQLGEYLPATAHEGFAAIQAQARATSLSLNEISRNGERLMKVAERALREGVFRSGSMGEWLMPHAERYHDIRELLSQLKNCRMV